MMLFLLGLVVGMAVIALPILSYFWLLRNIYGPKL